MKLLTNIIRSTKNPTSNYTINVLKNQYVNTDPVVSYTQRNTGPNHLFDAYLDRLIKLCSTTPEFRKDLGEVLYSIEHKELTPSTCNVVVLLYLPKPSSTYAAADPATIPAFNRLTNTLSKVNITFLGTTFRVTPIGINYVYTNQTILAKYLSNQVVNNNMPLTNVKKLEKVSPSLKQLQQYQRDNNRIIEYSSILDTLQTKLNSNLPLYTRLSKAVQCNLLVQPSLITGMQLYFAGKKGSAPRSTKYHTSLLRLNIPNKIYNHAKWYNVRPTNLNNVTKNGCFSVAVRTRVA